jgi:outer membrane protein
MRMILFTALAVSTLAVPPVSGQEVGAGSQVGAVSNNLGNGSTAIAYVSPEKAFADSPAGKAARAEFEKLQAEKSRAIDQKNEALRAQQAAYDTSATIMTDAARSQRQKELQKFQIDVERFIEVAQAELTGARRELEGAFLAKLRPAVEQVARVKGLQLVLNADTGVLVWGQPSLDITPDVVKELSAAAVVK